VVSSAGAAAGAAAAGVSAVVVAVAAAAAAAAVNCEVGFEVGFTARRLLSLSIIFFYAFLAVNRGCIIRGLVGVPAEGSWESLESLESYGSYGMGAVRDEMR